MNTQTQLFTNTNKNINSITRLHCLNIFETIHYKKVAVGCTCTVRWHLLGEKLGGYEPAGQVGSARPHRTPRIHCVNECHKVDGYARCPGFPQWFAGLHEAQRWELGRLKLVRAVNPRIGCDLAANQMRFKRLGAWAGWWRDLCSRSSTGG
jgi:hypothetical protein